MNSIVPTLVTAVTLVPSISDLPSQEDLEEYFNTFGEVVDCQVLMDEETGKNKGFAFILFDDFDSGEWATI